MRSVSMIYYIHAVATLWTLDKAGLLKLSHGAIFTINENGSEYNQWHQTSVELLIEPCTGFC